MAGLGAAGDSLFTEDKKRKSLTEDLLLAID
jgi:hypothetical protein